jgi:hypothetical protein
VKSTYLKTVAHNRPEKQKRRFNAPQQKKPLARTEQSGKHILLKKKSQNIYIFSHDQARNNLFPLAVEPPSYPQNVTWR